MCLLTLKEPDWAQAHCSQPWPFKWVSLHSRAKGACGFLVGETGVFPKLLFLSARKPQFTKTLND